MQHDFKGRAVLVTGAGVGIGRAAVELFAAQGAFVGVHCHRSRAEAATTLAGIQKAGGTGVVVQGDRSVPDQARAIVDDMVRAAGRLDVLVNNAGSPIQRAKLEECPLALWEKVIVFLASDAARFVTGALVDINGGRFLR